MLIILTIAIFAEDDFCKCSCCKLKGCQDPTIFYIPIQDKDHCTSRTCAYSNPTHCDDDNNLTDFEVVNQNDPFLTFPFIVLAFSIIACCLILCLVCFCCITFTFSFAISLVAHVVHLSYRFYKSKKHEEIEPYDAEITLDHNPDANYPNE